MGMAILKPYSGAQDETAEALEDLLAEAKAGGLIGLAYVAVRHRRSYSVGAAGEARTYPLLTRGMLLSLDDELAELMGVPKK